MSVIYKEVKVISPSSPFHNKIVDILIKDGIINTIAEQINAGSETVINLKGSNVSSGWIDIFANFCTPGKEQNETLASGSKAAASGGFTDVFLVPNTKPCNSGSAITSFIKSHNYGVNLHPVGAVTKDCEGVDLAEMYDMKNAGAVAFSDGSKNISSTAIMLKALQYLIPIDSVLIQNAHDHHLFKDGLMNEGIASTKFGMPSIPAIAEKMLIQRDIDLLQYTNSKLHITGVSTKKSIELIKDAKNKGLNITCSATPYHCFFIDENLHSYNTNLKVFPPLRDVKDREALKIALADGTIDCIASHHEPVKDDDKLKEFEYALPGMSTLQSVYSVLNSFISNQERIVELFTKAEQIFNLQRPKFAEGNIACLTFFNENESFIFTADKNFSLSNNNAFLNIPLKGTVKGIHNSTFTFFN